MLLDPVSAFPIRIRIHNSQLNADPRGSGSTSLIRTEKSVCMGIVDPNPVGSETFFDPVGSLSGMVHFGINFKETNTDWELIIPDRKKTLPPRIQTFSILILTSFHLKGQPLFFRHNILKKKLKNYGI
jgi:hypothetical protein